MNRQLLTKCEVIEYRIIEWIWSHWINIKLLNKFKVIEWILNYWIKTNKLNKINIKINFKVRDIIELKKEIIKFCYISTAIHNSNAPTFIEYFPYPFVL